MMNGAGVVSLTSRRGCGAGVRSLAHQRTRRGGSGAVETVVGSGAASTVGVAGSSGAAASLLLAGAGAGEASDGPIGEARGRKVETRPTLAPLGPVPGLGSDESRVMGADAATLTSRGRMMS